MKTILGVAERKEVPLDERAKLFASFAHCEQVRKYDGEMYFNHLRRVSASVRMTTTCINDEEAIAAAWLHDTVEDTATSIEMIEAFFGARVAQLVALLTNIKDPAKNRKTRKDEERQRFIDNPIPALHTIKVADIMDNLDSILTHDKEFGRVFLKEKRALYEVLTEADVVLYNRLGNTLNYWENRVESRTTLRDPPADSLQPAC